MRVIVSKQGQHDEQIFLITKALNFSAKFIVALYLKRFWSIQIKNSISKTMSDIRESVDKCLLFINQNLMLNKFFDELSKRGLT